MMIYRVENGIVVQVWQDCKTLVDYARKYLPPVMEIEPVGQPGDLDYVPALYRPADTPADLFEGDAVAGQLVELDGSRTNPPKPVLTAPEIRSERGVRLAAADWTQLADAPLTGAQVAAWAAYRQELRDITKQAGFPTGVNWPVEPV